MASSLAISVSKADREFAVGLARAFAGALLFSLPILMTMETWSLGYSIDRWRLALLLIGVVPILIGLSYYSGFEETTQVLDAAIDAFVAIAVATVMAVTVLYLFGVLTRDMGLDEWVGKVALQAVPGSIGALLAQSQLGQQRDAARQRRAMGDFGEYFLMCAGALFLSANIAPTEEVMLIAYLMSPWQTIVLVLVSLVLIHAFVYVVDFKGQHERPQHVSVWNMFIRFSVVGYVIALLISGYTCWTFGRFDGLQPEEIIRTTIVLGFPAAVGAAAARLVL